MNNNSAPRKKLPVNDLTGRVIGLAMKVHSELGPGFLESVYVNSLAHELQKAGLKVERERPIKIYYDSLLVGDFFADLFVEEILVLEIKAVRDLHPTHEVQTVNYLKATGTDTGLLINFGAKSLQFKRKFRQRVDERCKSEALRNPVNPVNPVKRP